jgi:para-aminobenzoate synthetase component 1
MVSSVTGELEDDVPFSKALEVAFPMGSMTGAPKVRVMQLIDEYESSARGLFSGSIGYITPDGDFDFNVVIRSLFINTEERAISFMAGGGITHYSSEEAEYEESILKTAAIRKVLNIKD